MVFSFLLLVNTTIGQNDTLSERCLFCDHHAHLNPYNHGIKNEWPFLVTAAAFAGAGIIFRYANTTQPFTALEVEMLNRNDVNSFDRSATYNWNEDAKKASDILIFTAFVFPAVFLANHHTRSDIGSLLLMGLEVASINFGVTAMVKNVAIRTRPYAYNTDLSFEKRSDFQSRLSFFSGHTSVTASFSFFFAKVMNDYHPNMKTGWKIGMWSFAALVPAATGYLRVQSGYHFKTDVITGYVVGATIGWLIPHLHKKRKANSKLSIYPTRVFDSSGIGLTLKL
jgi:membrane-associated phospholipid phosphatase